MALDHKYLKLNIFSLFCCISFLAPLRAVQNERKQSLSTTSQLLRMAQGFALVGVGVVGWNLLNQSSNSLLDRIASFGSKRTTQHHFGESLYQDKNFNAYASICAICIAATSTLELTRTVASSVYSLLFKKECAFPLDIPLLIGSALSGGAIVLMSFLSTGDSTTQARSALAATGTYGIGLLGSILYHRWKHDSTQPAPQ